MPSSLPVSGVSRTNRARPRLAHQRDGAPPRARAEALSIVEALPNAAVVDCEKKRQELERVFSHLNAEPSGTSSFVLPAPPVSVHGGSQHPLPFSHLRVQVGGGPEPPKQRDRQEKHDDFYANVGDAIRTLREDVPMLFTSELNYDIYREDIVFKDPRNTFCGMKNYKTIFWSLRFHGNLFFKQLYVEVKRIWQKTDDTICLRWTVHGLPRLPWDTEGTFDGVSTYKLDRHGKIYEHKVDNVIMGDPPLQRLPYLVTLNLAPSQQGTPFPTPWLNADAASSDECVRTPPGAA